MYLREHPDSQMRRAAYASWAYRCGHTDIAMLNYPLIRAGLPYDAIAPSICTAIEELIKDAKGKPATK
jgi:hypothetical protein